MISDSDGEAWKCKYNIFNILYAFVVGQSFDMICDYLVTVFISIAMIKHRSIKDDSVQHFVSFSRFFHPSLFFNPIMFSLVCTRQHQIVGIYIDKPRYCRAHFFLLILSYPTSTTRPWDDRILTRVGICTPLIPTIGMLIRPTSKDYTWLEANTNTQYTSLFIKCCYCIFNTILYSLLSNEFTI